jgi:phosphate starvation-inducible PhoH-like protein
MYLLFLLISFFSLPNTMNTLRTTFPTIRTTTYNRMIKRELAMRKSKAGNENGEKTFRVNNGRNISPNYFPKSDNQKKYVDFLNDPKVDLVFGVGPAGTGKTMFACSTAVQELKRGCIQKIIMTRPVVPVEKEDIGFLPGNINNKMDPWTRPLFDILLEYYSQKDIDSMLSGGVIEIAPLAFMRGRTFKRCFIIADEMQNSTPNQMLMLLTRIGGGSKMVVTGDMAQSDRLYDNGLRVFLDKIHRYRGLKSSIETCEFGNEDIERSPIVRKILDIYEGINYFREEKGNGDFDENGCDLYDEFIGNTEDEIEKSSENDEEEFDIIFTESDSALMPKKDISNNYKPNLN